MNRYEFLKDFKRPIENYITLGSIWRVKSKSIKSIDPTIIVMEKNENNFWICRIDLTNNESLERERAGSNMWAAIRSIEQSLDLGHEWRFAVSYSHYRTQATKKFILEYYDMIDHAPYLLPK